MLTDNIRRNVPATVAVLLLIISSFWIKTVPHDVENFSTNCVFQSLIDSINSGTILKKYLGAVFVFAICIVLYYINNKHTFINSREQLLPLILSLNISAFSFLHVFSGLHVALIFIALSFERIFRTYRTEYAFSDVFVAGFYSGMAGLFYGPSVILLVTLIFALLRIKPIKLRDNIVLVSGFVCPYYISSFYFFFSRDDRKIPFLKIIESFDFRLSAIDDFGFSQWIFIIISGLLTLFGLISTQTDINLSGRKTMAVNAVFIWTLIVLTACLIFFSADKNVIGLTVIPAAVLATNTFTRITGKYLNDSLLVIFVISAYAAFYLS